MHVIYDHVRFVPEPSRSQNKQQRQSKKCKGKKKMEKTGLHNRNHVFDVDEIILRFP